MGTGCRTDVGRILRTFKIEKNVEVTANMGQQHPDYLRQYHKVTYTNLLTSGKLNTYFSDIDRQAQERFEPHKGHETNTGNNA